MIPIYLDLIVLACVYPVFAFVAYQAYRDSKLMDECDEIEKRLESICPRPSRWERMVEMMRDTSTNHERSVPSG